jgi:hypothetical protein
MLLKKRKLIINNREIDSINFYMNIHLNYCNIEETRELRQLLLILSQLRGC